MILIGLGANLPSRYGDAEATLHKAVEALEAAGLEMSAKSRIWESAPVPVSDQPWYKNAVVAVKTDKTSSQIHAILLQTEESFGRVRGERNAPRVLDLDLLAYNDDIIEAGGGNKGDLIVPHPRLHERAFVLMPINDINSHWIHPKMHLTLPEMIKALPEGQICNAKENFKNDT